MMPFFCGSFFFFKQKTAYEMRISDWSSDVCSSDLRRREAGARSGLRGFRCFSLPLRHASVGWHPKANSHEPARWDPSLRWVTLQGPLAFLDFERFEEIARLDVGEVLGEGHAAFEPGPNLGDVVLEPAQRRDLALIDDDILARDARLQRLAEHALGHQQPGRLAVLAGREHLADFGAADDILDHQRSKLARHRRLHRVGEVVDDIVILKLNAAALGNLARLGVRTDVEADDRRARGTRQRHVALGDATDARMENADLDVLVRDTVDGIDDRLDRALHVGLDDKREFHRLVALGGEHILEIDLRGGRPLLLEDTLTQGSAFPPPPSILPPP